MSSSFTFRIACSSAVSRAKSTLSICRVYQSESGTFSVLSDKEAESVTGWLFMAYPGGRKAMSLRGMSVEDES